MRRCITMAALLTCLGVSCRGVPTGYSGQLTNGDLYLTADLRTATLRLPFFGDGTLQVSCAVEDLGGELVLTPMSSVVEPPDDRFSGSHFSGSEIRLRVVERSVDTLRVELADGSLVALTSR